MKVLDKIIELDNLITKSREAISTEVNNLNFDIENGVKFTIDEKLESSKLFDCSKKKGVYLFELNLESSLFKGKKTVTRINNFAIDWANRKNDSFFSSSVIKKRLKNYEKYDKQWLPLYIGKCNDIHKRIKEHIDLSPEKKTYAMKLKHRKNLHNLEFRVSILEIDVHNYDFIVPFVERTLREKYHPIIGKQ
ncbi:hypothetical protein ACK2M7_06825 [Chryseobacterium sp. TY4]